MVDDEKMSFFYFLIFVFPFHRLLMRLLTCQPFEEEASWQVYDYIDAYSLLRDGSLSFIIQSRRHICNSSWPAVFGSDDTPHN